MFADRKHVGRVLEGGENWPKHLLNLEMSQQIIQGGWLVEKSRLFLNHWEKNHIHLTHLNFQVNIFSNGILC